MFKNGMRPVHPGEVLREDYLIPLGLSAAALARALCVSAQRVNDLVRERRGIESFEGERSWVHGLSALRRGGRRRVRGRPVARDVDAAADPHLIVLLHVVEKALTEAAPQVEVEPDVADALETLGQRHLGAGLAPELHHQFGIAAELESGRGQLRAGLVAVQELLANLLFQSIDTGGDGRRRHVQPAGGGDQASGFDHLQEGAQFIEIHGNARSAISNIMPKIFRFSNPSASATLACDT